MTKKPCRERILDQLDEKANDGTRTAAQRESARRVRDHIREVLEKRAAMRQCPALCLMELSRAAATGNARTLELAYRYTNKYFWNNEAFCREAVSINREESLERVSEIILEKYFTTGIL
jgi:hypothetical protein